MDQLPATRSGTHDVPDDPAPAAVAADSPGPHRAVPQKR